MRAIKQSSALSEWVINTFVQYNPKVRKTVAGTSGHCRDRQCSTDSQPYRSLELFQRERCVHARRVPQYLS